ncbi:MAG: pilus assembly protein [Chloroflexi bacterium]|nr:pilus assembly protein [Chloroflexota bacterium]
MRIAGGRGQALVELALVAPVLLLMLAGALDLGRIFYYQIAITNAARVGAGYAIFSPSDLTGIQYRVLTEASTLSLSGGDVVVVTPNGTSPGNPIQVSVTYNFQAVTPIISVLWGGGPFALQAAATMVIQ